MNTDILMEWIITNGSTYLMRLLAAVAIFFIGRWIAGRLATVTNGLLRRANTDETLISFLTAVVRYALLAFVILSALSTLGIPQANFAALIAAAGLAVGFAMEGSLSNFAAGVMILGFRPYRKGDFVEINGATGFVEELSIINTILKTRENKRVIVPNGQVTSGNITNYSANGHVRASIAAGIGYDDNLREAKAIFLDILRNHPLVLETPAPSVEVVELGDNSVNFRLRPFCRVEDEPRVTFDVTEQVKLRCDEAGISIPYPQRDVHLFQAN